MKSGGVPESIESKFKPTTTMKITKFVTILAFCLNFVSCITVPVQRGGGYAGGGPVMMPRPMPMSMNRYDGGCDDRYNNGRRYYGGPNGAGQTIYHGSQSRHVYGNGPQSYSVIIPPGGKYPGT